MNKSKYRQILDAQVSDYLKDHKIKKFKAVKPKTVIRKANSLQLTPCPDCGSKLITEPSGLIICSQDRIKDIYDRCLEYEKADAKGKIEILKNDKNGNFMELYERWQFKDARGNRAAFTCNYSNKLHNATPHYSWWVIDVFQQKKLEKILKRKLTISEIEGSVKVRFKNKKGYWVEEQVLRYRFPWDFLK